ncbi:hypothetical protein F0562_021101 [Nyssa sinensis]|uniref:Exocyst component Exo84 C-terminal domain-containing protein n=1 Tax=Nyssa sinensis TaxID=561372 RepID=A0A5J5BKX7_9ASTE|nr:hypothetical protein F0562_021101 [Nyssa sinensis]
MDSSSSTSRFRFRDHQEMGDGDSTDGSASSDTTSVSSDADEEPELKSMTGQGINHLCSELLELKRVSDEDFHKNIFSNYLAFVRIFEEVEGMENELMQLKHHVSTQKMLVKDLTDGTYLKVLSKEAMESIIKEPAYTEPSPPSMLVAHADNVSEILDVLLSEHRLDEVLAILEMEAGTFQSMRLQENFPLDVLMSYKSAISERRAMVADQLTLVAENPRVSAPELQKALVGLCKLGDSHIATQLLVKYYHSRIASGIHSLQYSKTVTHGVYIHEVAKFVFSMISQAARSFVVLYGENSPHASEFIQWACEETEVFASCFNKYVRSISETSGGLLMAVEAVQSAMSYCSLLEIQKIVLRQDLVKHVRPCMEEVLQVHIDHFKKVTGIFTSSDTWVVGRYLVSGILNEGSSSMVIGQQLQYCLLTNSGRKFVTLLQAVTEDVSPLLALQMEGPILRGLMDLTTEYIVIPERALTCETNGIEKCVSRINLAESPAQQISVIVNLSTLVHFFSRIIRSVFKGIDNFSFEIDSFILFIEEASDRVRAHFCQQFIYKIMSHEGGYRLMPETCVVGQGDSNIFQDLMPSVVFQVLFVELRKLEKLAEDDVVEVGWLMELLKELMEAIFVWISNNEEIWTITDEDLTVQHAGNFKQFVLDMQFLVEITRCGGYFSDSIMNASLDLVSQMESSFISAGLDPKRDINDDSWAINAAREALQNLQGMEETNEPTDQLEEELNEYHSIYASDTFEDDGASKTFEDNDALSSSENYVKSVEDLVVAINTNTEIPKIEFFSPVEVVDLDGQDGFDDKSAAESADSSIELEDLEAENATDSGTDEFQKMKLPDTQVSVGNVGEASGAWISTEDKTSSQNHDSEQMIQKRELQKELKGQGQFKQQE